MQYDFFYFFILFIIHQSPWHHAATQPQCSQAYCRTRNRRSVFMTHIVMTFLDRQTQCPDKHLSSAHGVILPWDRLGDERRGTWGLWSKAWGLQGTESCRLRWAKDPLHSGRGQGFGNVLEQYQLSSYVAHSLTLIVTMLIGNISW